MPDILIYIIIGVIVISIIFFIVRSVIKLLFIVGIIFLLFHLGFLWAGDDLNSKLGLNQVLEPEVNEVVQSEYDRFAEKREEHAVIDTEKLKDLINQTAQNIIGETEKAVSNIDKDVILKELEEKLQNYEVQPEDIEKALKESELQNNFTEEELQELGNQLRSK